MSKELYKKIVVVFIAICFAILAPAFFGIENRSLSYYAINTLIFLLGYGAGFYNK